MKRLERTWMYERFDANKRINVGFLNGVREFVNYVKEQESFTRNDGKMRCPCIKCCNAKFLNEYDVKQHLTKNGFCLNYYDWVCHGEAFPLDDQVQVVRINPYQNMVNDALLDHINDLREDALNAEVVDERPHPEVRAFFDMLNKAEQPVYEGSNVSVLEAASRLINLKCEHNLSHKCVDGISSLIGDILPNNNFMASNFYQTKKLLRGLQLPHEKIDVCTNGCMLFWKEDQSLDKCKKCERDRYKPMTNARGKRVPYKVLIYFPIAPRLQRLYATKHIAREMRWHKENPRVRGVMAHPSDAASWKHFDSIHTDFAKEPRNVRLGLCTDGFAPFGQFGKGYSSWPVMVTPYNLPPWLCMKKQFIFLSLVIPGPRNPKKNLDVYLQPLIHDLKELWENGVYTYDVDQGNNFKLKAALMWTINDFPAYGMLSGWSTAGKYACPYCGPLTKSFWLKNGGKHTWFDCHRPFLAPEHPFRKDKYNFHKDRPEECDGPPPMLNGDQVWECVEHLPMITTATDEDLKELKAKREGWWKRSIFWELSYWKTLLIRHNLDVMHIEKNFFEQLIHTIMGNKNKTSHGPKSKLDVKLYCRRPHDCKFALDKPKRKVLCDWLSKLKFPDNYASDLSRCVDQNDFTLHGLKSHDCHVFMERLLPVALRYLIPRNEWNAITEISQFFRDLCVSTIKVDDVSRLQNNIAEILCKLEKIFPPSFFNSMEHLPIHLAHEVEVGGPVQYRWMYPFERFLNHLKQKIGNKAFIEGSICNAYLLEEISNFCSMYFEEHVDTKAKNLDVGSSSESNDSYLPELFQDHGGKTTGKCRVRLLDDKEYECAHKYVLSNCEILRPYKVLFEEFISAQHNDISQDDIWSKYDTQFPKWFRQQVILLKDDLLKALAMGPDRHVTYWKRYSINGYNFRTFNKKNDVEKCTINNGVCVSSTEGDDYYGTLDEVIELKYVGSLRVYKTIVFKCDWMDNSPHGVDVHKDYKLVEVHRGRKYQVYEPFVLAHQVEQVYYAPYPNMKRDRDQWSVVFKTKARSTIEAPVDETFFQEQVVTDVPHLSSLNNDESEYDDNEVVDDDELLFMTEEEGDEEEPLPPNSETQQNSDDDDIVDLQVDENFQLDDDEDELFPNDDNDNDNVDANDDDDSDD